MSGFGKTLVFLQLAMSIVFATIAMVMYTNRPDWSMNKGKDGGPDGELLQRKQLYDTLATASVRPSDVNWRDSHTRVLQNEWPRAQERRWFAQQIEFVKTGATEKNPALQVNRGNDGRPVLQPNPSRTSFLLQMVPPSDSEGKAKKDRDGKDLALKSLAWYDKELKQAADDITREMKRLQVAAQKDLDATNKLKGPKGLIARYHAEQGKHDRVVEENKELRPLWLNAAVELQNLEDLRERLNLRLRELAPEGR
jgi:hypothetical protein